MCFRMYLIMYLFMSCYWFIVCYNYPSGSISQTDSIKLCYRAVSHVFRYELVDDMLLIHFQYRVGFFNDDPDLLIHSIVDLAMRLHAYAHASTRSTRCSLHPGREETSSKSRVRLRPALVWVTVLLISSVSKGSNQHAWHIAVCPNRATNASYGNI